MFVDIGRWWHDLISISYSGGWSSPHWADHDTCFSMWPTPEILRPVAVNAAMNNSPVGHVVCAGVCWSRITMLGWWRWKHLHSQRSATCTHLKSCKLAALHSEMYNSDSAANDNRIYYHILPPSSLPSTRWTQAALVPMPPSEPRVRKPDVFS